MVIIQLILCILPIHVELSGILASSESSTPLQGSVAGFFILARDPIATTGSTTKTTKDRTGMLRHFYSGVPFDKFRASLNEKFRNGFPKKESRGVKENEHGYTGCTG